LKSASKTHSDRSTKGSSGRPKSSFGEHKCSKWRLSKKRGLVADGCPKRRFWNTDRNDRSLFYPSQTKILEGRTNLSECVFEALFKGVSTRFGLQTVEKCFEKFDENAFGNVLPTSKIFVLGPYIFEALFNVSLPKSGITPLKRASKKLIEMFVRPSKIFVWEHQNAFPMQSRRTQQ
jgi:hypothetical protein